MSDDMKTRLLDAAQLLVQTRGHNGYSYRDLAAEVGIRTASIHYHFPGKTDLTVALVRRYRETVANAMAAIAVEKTSLSDRLEGVAATYLGCLKAENRICVAAALAGEYSGLPKEVQQELSRLITDSQGWIARFLTEGRTRGEIPAGSDPVALARLWYAALQGALVMARATEGNALAEVAEVLQRLTLNPK
jgi:TetR/AcrR family transcriptional regulator, transcriptional repressor for nem operon